MVYTRTECLHGPGDVERRVGTKHLVGTSDIWGISKSTHVRSAETRKPRKTNRPKHRSGEGCLLIAIGSRTLAISAVVRSLPQRRNGNTGYLARPCAGSKPLIDLSCLVYQKSTNTYAPYNKEWIKEKIYVLLRQAAGNTA
uniref:Uncharacterized protein n=1 Tax=Anopheles farauti TaxID=69004 RepID=A0A182Q4W2_9DIPT